MIDPSQPFVTSPRRVARVYVASVFEDTQEEREVLVKRIFPELLRRCRRRQVEFVPVYPGSAGSGLKNDSESLCLRLTEIDECRPYLVVILGQQSGLAPGPVDPELVARHLWLAEHLDKTFLELEILHGALNDPGCAHYCHFYFRDPAGQASSPRRNVQPTLEAPGIEQNFEVLKDRIRFSGLRLRETYKDAEGLGRLVLEDLWASIDMQFPEASVPSPLDRCITRNEALIASRRDTYAAPEGLYESLETHTQNSGPPLVVKGEPGIGKSALLSNWVARYRSSHPDHLVVHQWSGIGHWGSDLDTVLACLVAQIKRSRGLTEPIPETSERLRTSLPFWLERAAAEGPTLLVLDGLDRLKARNEDPLLDWLPETFPANLHVVVAACPGAATGVMERRGWPCIELPGLQPEQRRGLLVTFLDHHGRSMSAAEAERLVEAPQTALPLFLRIVLKTLQGCRTGGDPGEIVQACLKAGTVAELYDETLARWEREYQEAVPNLVGNVVSLLWAARTGLYESEMLRILRLREQQISFENWSSFFSALRPFLLNSDGVLNFFHGSFRDAVENRYLKTPKAKQARHLRLALHFLARETDDRKAEELPWQLEQAEAWDSLRNAIADAALFRKLFLELSRHELFGYWRVLDRRLDMPAAYEDSALCYEKTGPSEARLASTLCLMADFLTANGALDVAEKLCRKALGLQDAVLGESTVDTAGILDRLARILVLKAAYEAAGPLYRRVLEIREQTLGQDHPETLRSAENLAAVLKKTQE